MAGYEDDLDFSGNRQYDPARFEDLVLFIAWAMRDDPGFGRTKLAKALFYLDFDAYAGEGESLTGSTYEHWDHGPFPPQLYKVEAKLVRECGATLREPEHPGDEAKLLPASEDEPEFGAWLQDWIKHMAARRASDLARERSWQVEEASHKHPGWELTRDRKPIPYNTHYIPRRRERPPEEAFEWARQVVRDYERSQRA